MKKIFLLLITLNCFASIPKPEDFFQNHSSSLIKNNYFSAKINIKKKSPDNKVLQTINAKVFWYKTGESASVIWNVTDTEGAVYSYTDLLGTVKKNRAHWFFYGILSSVFTSNSHMMSQFLKTELPEYKTNAELVNLEKANLYNSQKEYLAAAKNDKSLTPEKAPFSLAQNQELLKQDFYKDTPQVRMEKCADEYCYQLKYNNFEALAYSDSLALQDVRFTFKDRLLESKIREYQKIGDTYYIPQKIYVSTTKDIYELTISEFSDGINKKAFSEKLREVEAQLKKLKDNSKNIKQVFSLIFP